MQIEDRTKCTHTYTHYTEAHIFLFNDVSVPCADEVWGDVREKKTVYFSSCIATIQKQIYVSHVPISW